VEKRLKTRSLTAADIPEIVSTVMEAMPQPREAGATPATSWKTKPSCRRHESTDQPSQAMHSRDTGRTPTDETQHSSEDEDVENEDFGKLSLCMVLFEISYNRSMQSLPPYSAHHIYVSAPRLLFIYYVQYA